MGNENGEWIMRGMASDDPRRLRTPEQLIEAVNEIGFLPLFRNSVPGFSVEERTLAGDWWTGDEERDPWEWRRLLAEGKQAAYGRFFDRKAGFISLDWLPDFANWRRDGYDFDALWEDEKASWRQKKIMDLFENGEEMFSFDVKRKAGFGAGGEKNFEGVLADLMMRTYLAVRDFRCRVNQRGKPYGWNVAVYAAPESIFGREKVTKAYHDPPAVSEARIFGRVRSCFPGASENQIQRIMRFQSSCK